MGTVAADPDIALVEKVIAAYNAGDPDAILRLYHPDVTIIPTPEISPPGTVYHGHEGFRAVSAAIRDRFASIQIEPRELRSVEGRVLAMWTSYELEHGSDEAVAREAVHLLTCEGGLVRRVEGFQTEEDALAAARRQGPLDAARRYLAAFRRGDPDGMAAECHQDVQVFPSRALVPVGTSYKGREGIRSMVAGYRWSSYEVESEDLRESGGRVIASIVITVPEEGGRSVKYDLVLLLTFEDEQIRLVEGFSTPLDDTADHPADEEYRVLFDEIPDATFLVDDACHVIDGNAAAERLGMSPAQRGRPLAVLVPSLVSLTGESWKRILAEGQFIEEYGADTDAGAGQVVHLRVKANFLPGRHLVIVRRGDEERPAPPPAGEPQLTPREREIFRLLALGFSGRDIAKQLFLSPETVRTHVHNGVGRLGARTRGHAIAIALTRGEITL
jgi:DNA-binding CsgD family transcriptional regulator/ketosteroid isomerase-like protein